MDIVAQELEPRPGRGAQEELHPRRRDAVRDAERLRLRLGRLRALPRQGADADRLPVDRRAAARRRVAREAARGRHRLDARLGHEQLRPVAARQPGPAVLGQQRGRDGEARHLRRDRRHARHDAAGAGRTRRRRRRWSRTSSASRPTSERARRPRLVLELARRLLGDVRVAVRRHRPRRGQGRDRHARARRSSSSPARVLGGVAGGDRARRTASRASRATRRRRCRSWPAARSSTRTTRCCRSSCATSRSTAATSTCRRTRCRTRSASTAT